MRARPALTLLLCLAGVACEHVREPPPPPRPSAPPTRSAGPPPLETVELGEGSDALVLLHGYGAPGDDLVPLARALLRPGLRVVLPAAPLPLPASNGRAWWPLGDVRARRAAGADLSVETPPGLDTARARVLALLERLEGRGVRRVVIGGFSQGAMLAMDVAFSTERPLSGLLAMSGTVVRRPTWTEGRARRRGMPALLSHGTSDPLLDHGVSEGWARELEAAGLDLRWVSFPGGHAIPRPVIEAAGALLRDALGE